jgi:hypothetical protein
MNELAGACGDERRATAVARLSQQIVSHGSVVIRAIGGDRNGELSAHRVLGRATSRRAKRWPAWRNRRRVLVPAGAWWCRKIPPR